MKKDSGKLTGILNAVKARRAILIVLAAFLLIGLISYWSYQKTMTKLLNNEILTGQNVNNVAADIAKEDVTDEPTHESTTEAPPATEPSNSMGFEMPLEGELTNGFSNGDLVKSETLGYWLTHDGVDIKAENGTAVLSAGEGVVEDVYDDPLWGTCVVIDHKNGVKSYYFGLNKDLDVSEGDEIVTGQKIGTVGETAEIESKLGAHLHFAMKQNDEWIDPVLYVNDN